MTRLDIIKEHQRQYAELSLRIASMPESIERAVAQYLILPWIKGVKWMGGMSDAKAQRAFETLQTLGYTDYEIFSEYDRQMAQYH